MCSLFLTFLAVKDRSGLQYITVDHVNKKPKEMSQTDRVIPALADVCPSFQIRMSHLNI